jgi:hypothetical protein
MVYKLALSFIELNHRKEPDGILSSIEEGVNLDNVPAKPGVYIVLSDKENFFIHQKNLEIII